MGGGGEGGPVEDEPVDALPLVLAQRVAVAELALRRLVRPLAPHLRPPDARRDAAAAAAAKFAAILAATAAARQAQELSAGCLRSGCGQRKRGPSIRTDWESVHPFTGREKAPLRRSTGREKAPFRRSGHGPRRQQQSNRTDCARVCPPTGGGRRGIGGGGGGGGGAPAPTSLRAVFGGRLGRTASSGGGRRWKRRKASILPRPRPSAQNSPPFLAGGRCTAGGPAASVRGRLRAPERRRGEDAAETPRGARGRSLGRRGGGP